MLLQVAVAAAVGPAAAGARPGTPGLVRPLGGWLLVARTETTLWDLDRDPPALLVPGTRVRFVDA